MCDHLHVTREFFELAAIRILSPADFYTQLQTLRVRSEREIISTRTGEERDALCASVAHLFELQSVLREYEIRQDGQRIKLDIDPRTLGTRC